MRKALVAIVILLGISSWWALSQTATAKFAGAFEPSPKGVPGTELNHNVATPKPGYEFINRTNSVDVVRVRTISAASYRFRDPAGEKLLMGALKNPATLKIFRIGTDTAGWEIQRDSDNLPSYRYKTMKVYFRDPNDDHPYCRVVSARIKQDYAGGGRYNSEIYCSSVSDEIFGCP